MKRQVGDQLELEWRSFLLRPQPEPRPQEKFVAYTKSWLRPAEMEPATTFNVWATENAGPSHSMPSSIAGKLAESFGDEASFRFHRRLLEAYFTENRTVSDDQVLADVAADVGIDRTLFTERLATEARALSELVIEDHNLAVNSGITGVPAVVVNDTYLLTGAMEVEQYLRVVDRMSAEAEADSSDGAGPTESTTDNAGGQ